MGFPDSSVGKESAYDAGDLGSIPGLGRSPREGNSNPLQYSCLENPMDRGAWRATVHRVTKSQTRLSDFHFTSLHMSDAALPSHALQGVLYIVKDFPPGPANDCRLLGHSTFNTRQELFFVP